MNQDELRTFFGELLKQDGFISSDSLAVMGKLIRLTLDYRDHWLAEKNDVLTVAETRQALDIYTETVKSGKMPDNLNEKISGLVKLWLKEIDGRSIIS